MSENFFNTGNVMLEKQVQPLFKATLSGGLANIFAAVLVFSLLLNTHHKDAALWLCGVIVLLSAIRIILVDNYLTKKKFAFKTYLKAHTLLTFIIGATWAAIRVSV